MCVNRTNWFKCTIYFKNTVLNLYDSHDIWSHCNICSFAHRLCEIVLLERQLAATTAMHFADKAVLSYTPKAQQHWLKVLQATHPNLSNDITHCIRHLRPARFVSHTKPLLVPLSTKQTTAPHREGNASADYYLHPIHWLDSMCLVLCHCSRFFFLQEIMHQVCMCVHACVCVCASLSATVHANLDVPNRLTPFILICGDMLWDLSWLKWFPPF